MQLTQVDPHDLARIRRLICVVHFTYHNTPSLVACLEPPSHRCFKRDDHSAPPDSSYIVCLDDQPQASCNDTFLARPMGLQHRPLMSRSTLTHHR